MNKKSKRVYKAAQRKISKSGTPIIYITFPWHYADLAAVKSLEGRKFYNRNGKKYWVAPVLKENIQILVDAGFIICQHLAKILLDGSAPADIPKIDIPGLNGTLFPYQNEGVSWLESKKGRGLIGDEMGLGKTVQALAWLQLHPEKRKVLIIVPSSLKLNWAKEAQKWMTNPDVEILSGKTPHELTGDIIIINYDIVAAWQSFLIEQDFKVLILDECHYIKNGTTERTKSIKKIAKYIKHIISLSGTPILNSPIEIYNAVKLINPALFPSKWHFQQKYCDMKHNGFGWDYSGASNIDELHRILSEAVMIRRLKKDVLKDLPEKTRSFIPLEIDNRKEYNESEQDFISYIKNKTAADLEIQLRESLGEELFDMVDFKDHKLERLKKEKAHKAEAGGMLARLTALRQIAAKGKMTETIQWITNFLESGEKLVIMAIHKAIINELMEEFKNIAVKVDGSVSNKQRHKNVELFQNNDNIRLFVGNVKAAGVGLTLTAASNIAFLELPWTPGELQQAEDRVHRIGQKNAVQVHYLLSNNTIEKDMADALDKKRQILDGVLDGVETPESSLLSILIEKYLQT